MKSMFESAECFEAYATVDYCHYMLEEIQKGLNKKRSPIDTMIDEVTGYSKAKTEESRQQIIGLLEEIIKAKKVLDAPIADNVKHLEKLKNLA